MKFYINSTLIISLVILFTSCKKANFKNDVKGVWKMDSICYYKAGLTKKIDFGKKEYFTEFNSFGDVVLFDKQNVLYAKEAFINDSSFITNNDFLEKIVATVISNGFVRVGGQPDKYNYLLKKLTNNKMELEYERTTDASGDTMLMPLDSTSQIKYVNGIKYWLSKGEWKKVPTVIQLDQVKVMLYYSKYKNQCIKSEIFQSSDK